MRVPLYLVPSQGACSPSPPNKFVGAPPWLRPHSRPGRAVRVLIPVRTSEQLHVQRPGGSYRVQTDARAAVLSPITRGLQPLPAEQVRRGPSLATAALAAG